MKRFVLAVAIAAATVPLTTPAQADIRCAEGFEAVCWTYATACSKLGKFRPQLCYLG